MNSKSRVIVPEKTVGKYRSPVHLPIGSNRQFGKEYMPADQLRLLFSGRVIVEEKMDGKHTRCAKKPFVFFAEDMLKRKRVAYSLPGRYAIFDIFDLNDGLFLGPDDKMNLVTELANSRQHLLPPQFRQGRVFPVPYLASGIVSISDLNELMKESAYAFYPASGNRAPAEGIVVKPFMGMLADGHIAGKLLTRELLDIYTSPPKQRMKPLLNKITPGMDWKNTEF